MKKKKLFALVAVLFAASSLLTLLFYSTLEESVELLGAERVDTISMDFTVGDRVGLNADTGRLSFGIIMPGSGAKRWINITNTHPYDVSVRLYSRGNISRFVSFPQESTVLPNESRSIQISAAVPLDASFESYSGTLRIALFPE